MHGLPLASKQKVGVVMRAAKASVTVLALCAALAGCADSGNEPQASAQPTERVTVTVTATTTTTGVPEPSLAPESPSAATSKAAATVRGTLQLLVNRNPNYPENCAGFTEEGYGDIHVGQQCWSPEKPDKPWPLDGLLAASSFRWTAPTKPGAFCSTSSSKTCPNLPS